MSASELPQRIDHDAPVFVISVAAQLAGMHPQTLRTYDRMGLVSPRRTPKRGRRYSARDIARLRLIQRLSQDEGSRPRCWPHCSRRPHHESSPLIRSAACISGGVGGDHRWLFLAALCRRQTPIR